MTGLRCKICASRAYPLGQVDRLRCCIDRLGTPFYPPSGEMVTYERCGSCGFIFARAFDRFSAAEWRDTIYNDDYERLNPPIPGHDGPVPLHRQPAYLKGVHIAHMLEADRRTEQRARVLDFGSGGDPGPTGQALIDQGHEVVSFDPFRGADTLPIDGRAPDLIIAIEVLEHVSDFDFLRAALDKMMPDHGQIYIETMLHPHDAGPDVMKSWYIAPRDGHISIHTPRSIAALFSAIGMGVHFGEGFVSATRFC